MSDNAPDLLEGAFTQETADKMLELMTTPQGQGKPSPMTIILRNAQPMMDTPGGQKMMQAMFEAMF